MMEGTFNRHVVGAIVLSTASAIVGAASLPIGNSYVFEGFLPSYAIAAKTAGDEPGFTEKLKLDLHASDMVHVRLDALASLDEDHDGEGASAPDLASLAVARRYLSAASFDAPVFNIGLTSSGDVVAEFREDGNFGQIIFYADNTAEAYYAVKGSPSVLIEGQLSDPFFQRDFIQAFGFELEA